MNSNNTKRIGLDLLKKIQVLYQNKAISTDEKNEMSLLAKEGMTTGTFYKLNLRLFDFSETTILPQVVDEMIQLTIF